MDTIDPVSTIFHEKQEGSLCAQHCLNALLQGNYFTAVDLAAIGRELDEVERQQMAEAGVNSEEYQRFVQQPSSNYDDSGFFSIQVIQRAVRVWNLELIPFTSSDQVALGARENPRCQQAYICNFREHWFTIRKLGNQWFNLNSLLTHPELVSDMYLSLLLTQLQQEGYSIFIVVGKFPDSEADQMLKIVMAVQPVKPKLITENKPRTEGQGTSSNQFEDQDLALALEESKRLMEEDDQSLKRALAMSMEGLPADFAFPLEQLTNRPSQEPNQGSESETTSQPTPSAEELREKRLAFYKNEPGTSNKDDTEKSNVTDGPTQDAAAASSAPNKPTQSQSDKVTNISEISEDQMLQLALKMSMEEDT